MFSSDLEVQLFLFITTATVALADIFVLGIPFTLNHKLWLRISCMDVSVMYCVVSLKEPRLVFCVPYEQMANHT